MRGGRRGCCSQGGQSAFCVMRPVAYNSTCLRLYHNSQIYSQSAHICFSAWNILPPLSTWKLLGIFNPQLQCQLEESPSTLAPEGCPVPSSLQCTQIPSLPSFQPYTLKRGCRAPSAYTVTQSQCLSGTRQKVRHSRGPFPKGCVRGHMSRRAH